jgi:hypothetical protein
VAEHIHSASGAVLLALEPGAETTGVEDVFTREFLAALEHVFSADDADGVCHSQLLLSGIGIQSVEVPDGLVRGQNVIHTLLKVLGSDEDPPCDVQRDEEDPHHEQHVAHVQTQLHKTDSNVDVSHVDCLVLPGVLAAQVNRMEDVVEKCIDAHQQHYGVLQIVTTQQK